MSHVEEFANSIIRAEAAGDRRDYILDRAGDPVVEIVKFLNKMKAERRKFQAETSECIVYRQTKGKIEFLAAEPERLEALNT
jgi:hypothetical protein